MKLRGILPRTGFILSIIIISISLLLNACSDSTEPTQETIVPTSTPVMSQVFGTYYPVVEPPEIAPLLRWDFSRMSDSHLYLMELKADYYENWDFPMPANGDLYNQNATASANLIVESQGDHTAKVIMDNIEMSISFSYEDGTEEGPISNTQPPQEIQGMREDGTIDHTNSSEEMGIKLLFSLPPEPMQIGETVVVPASIPFEDCDETFPLNGSINITLIDYINIDGQTCAHLKCVTDLSDLQIPDEMEDELDWSAKADSELIFSIDQNKFIAAEIHVNMAFSEGFDSSDYDFGDYNGPIPDTIKLITEIEESIRIQIIEEEINEI